MPEALPVWSLVIAISAFVIAFALGWISLWAYDAIDARLVKAEGRGDVTESHLKAVDDALAVLDAWLDRITVRIDRGFTELAGRIDALEVRATGFDRRIIDVAGHPLATCPEGRIGRLESDLHHRITLAANGFHDRLLALEDAKPCPPPGLLLTGLGDDLKRAASAFTLASDRLHKAADAPPHVENFSL